MIIETALIDVAEIRRRHDQVELFVMHAALRLRAGLAAQKQIAGALGAFANMVASRVQRERLAIYGTLAKVQLSNTQSSQRCDERCLVGQSGAGGVVVRQKCCGALVCTNCLFVHNFQASQSASHLHAPCFSCQRMRGIFKRTAAAE